LRALEPNADSIPHPVRSASEDGYSTAELYYHPEKQQKKAFWSWERNKDNDKDRDKPNRDRAKDEGTAELTKMIGPSSVQLSVFYSHVCAHKVI
jgi:hypothetical protein